MHQSLIEKYDEPEDYSYLKQLERRLTRTIELMFKYINGEYNLHKLDLEKEYCKLTKKGE